jgi:hypothetical protein
MGAVLGIYSYMLRLYPGFLFIPVSSNIQIHVSCPSFSLLFIRGVKLFASRSWKFHKVNADISLGVQKQP